MLFDLYFFLKETTKIILSKYVHTTYVLRLQNDKITDLSFKNYYISIAFPIFCMILKLYLAI